MSNKPIFVRWDGEALIPNNGHWQNVADEQFVVGEIYRVEVEEMRSWVSHQHQFAWLHEAWANLPERMYQQFPTSEHLRKYALIQGGYCTMVQHPCVTAAEALRLATILKPYDSYAVVICRGNVVSVYTAVSQSVKHMGKDQFQASKTAILEYVAGLLEVDPATLERQAAA